jgi:hypothetical protein
MLHIIRILRDMEKARTEEISNIFGPAFIDI